MDGVRGQVEGAQSALAAAIAKAGLAADPLGQALHALSLSIGAQLSIHDAAMQHYSEMAARLDQAVVEAVQHGEIVLNERRETIIANLAPHLAEAVRHSVRSWNRVVSARTVLTAAGLAIACTITVGSLCFGAGWKAGEASGVSDKGTLAAAIAQAGPDAAIVLAQLVRNNNLPGVIADCRKNLYVQDGRRACVIPVWLDPSRAPAKPNT